MSQERSAEFLRGWLNGLREQARECTVVMGGDLPHVTQMSLIERADEIRALLAEAEAREASVPTATDIAVADELDMLSAHIQEYIGPDDARDDIRRICRNRAADLRLGAKRGPTAAAVITAAERALESWREVMNSHGEWDDGCFYYARTSASELQSRIECNDTAFAAIAKWKEAQRGPS